MSITYSDIKGVIFDLGYTLIEYKNGSWPEVNAKAKKFAYEKLTSLNINLPDFDAFDHRYETIKEKYRAAAFEKMEGWKVNHVLNDVLSEYEIKDPGEYADCFVEALFSFTRSFITVPESTVRVLYQLKKNGYRTGVISNTIFPGYLHDRDLDFFGIASCLDFRIYSSEFGRRKPHREIFAAGLEKIGLPSSQVAYVGDRFDMDARGAQQAGLIPIIKFCEKEKYPEPLPSDIAIIYHIPELLELLNGNPSNE